MGKKSKKGNLQAITSNELVFEFSRETHGFSENRWYAGLWYTITVRTTIQIGYVWIYSVADPLNNSDIIYFTLRNNFAL